jgi:hypothetical protein
VDVRVDQPRHQRDVAQIAGFGTRRQIGGRSHGADDAAVDANESLPHRTIREAIPDAVGEEHPWCAHATEPSVHTRDMISSTVSSGV